jgi:hypothetical protein
MAGRVSAHIMIGGLIPRSQYPDFVQAIAHDNPAIDWNGTPFDPAYLPLTDPLTLMDHEVANGCFGRIEMLPTSSSPLCPMVRQYRSHRRLE